MSTVGGQYLDIAEIRKGKNADNSVAVDIINMLAQTNGMFDDAVWKECNNGTKHRHTVMSGLPDVAWGKLYQGIQSSKAKRTQVEDVTGFVEALSTVDARLARIEKDLPAFRLQEAQAFIESMAQELQRAMIYENSTTNPDRITGLAPRFSSLSAQNGNQIVNGNGSESDNTSIWFVTWGGQACHMIYPEGTQYGIQREDMGKQKVHDADGNPYFALEEMFSAHCGVAVRDWRKVVRIANIDVSALRAGTVDLYGLMRKAYHRVHGLNAAQRGTSSIDSGDGNFKPERVAIYCNSDVFEALDGLGTNGGNSDNYVRLSPMEIQGRLVDTYRKIPVIRTDQIVNNEAVVS